MRFFPLIFLAIASALRAQEPGILTSRAVRALAREHSPATVMANGRMHLTAGRGRAEAAWPNPVAEWRRENLDSPLSPDIFATLQVPVDITGRRLALRAANTLAGRRALADSGLTMRDLDVNVLRAFWRASLTAELARIAVAERDAREATATFDVQRFREGAVAEVVAMRARIEADRARIAHATALADAVRAREELARFIGVPSGSLGALAPPAAIDIERPLPDTAWTTVANRRPDLVVTRLAATESEQRWRAERRGVIGEVNVVGGYKATGGYATGLLGVLVPLPLFNRNEGQRQRARGEQIIARADLLDAELRARGELAAAMQAWLAVRDAARAGASTLDDRASEVASIAEASYREGAISLMELIEAQRTRAETRAAAARWIVDAHLAWLELHRSAGASLPDE